MAEGRIRMRATLDSVAAKKSGTVVQLVPDDYTTPEDFAELFSLRGKVVAVEIVDPEQPLPLQYDEEEGDAALVPLEEGDAQWRR